MIQSGLLVGKGSRAHRQFNSGRRIKAVVRAVAEALERRQLLSVTSAQMTVPNQPVEGQAMEVDLLGATSSGAGTNWQLVLDGDTQNPISAYAPEGVSTPVMLPAQAEPGTLQVTAHATDASDSSDPGVDASPLNLSVWEAALSLNGIQATVVANYGTPFDGTIATFTDANPLAQVTDYSTSIDWGDGFSGTGTIVPDGNGGWLLQGSHTYSQQGVYPVSVAVMEGGSGVSAWSDIVLRYKPGVVNAILSVRNSTTEGHTEGQDVQASVYATTTDGAGTIWYLGVNNSTIQTSVPEGQWANIDLGPLEEGTTTLLAHVIDADASTDPADIWYDPGVFLPAQTIDVSDAPIQCMGSYVTIQEGDPSSISLGTLVDQNPRATASDFTAWDSSLVFVPDPLRSDANQSVFDIETQANTLPPGNYNFCGSILDQGGESTYCGAYVDVVDAPLTLDAGASVPSGLPTQPTVTVGTLSDANALAQPGDFAGSVTWSNGNVVSASFTPVPNSPGTFTVSAPVTCDTSAPSSSGFGLSVTDISGGTTLNSSGTLNVFNPLTPPGSPPGGVLEGQSTGTLLLANFTLPDPTSYLEGATVDWGDLGPVEVADATVNPDGSYTITGDHTYAEEGTYDVKVRVVVGYCSNTPTESEYDTDFDLSVGDAPISLADAGLALTEGQAFSDVTIATLTDQNPGEDVGDFTGIADLGDEPQPLTFVAEGLGVFAVQIPGVDASDEKSLTADLSVWDAGGASASGSATITVADAPLTVSASDPGTFIEASQVNAQVVGQVTDTSPEPDPSDLSGVIDWGDGATSTATLQPVDGQPGTYDIIGSHQYAEEGTFPLSVTVNDEGGASNEDTTSVQVADAPIHLAPGAAVFAAAGTSTGVLDLGTLTDEDPAGDPSDYTNSAIDWGDGQTSAPIFQPDLDHPGVFTVQGSHTYANGGYYNITLTANDTESSDQTTVPATVVELRSLTATDDANPSNFVIAGDGSTTGNDLYLGINRGATNVVVDLSADYIPADQGQWVLWKVEGDVAAPASGSFAGGGMRPVTLTPTNGNYDYTAEAGVDANQDGVLQSYEITRTIHIHVITLDVRVDSDNNGAITADDEAIKDDSSLPGKVIIANTLDQFGNHVPGYADFNSWAALQPMEVTLSPNVDINKAVIKFDYNDAPPLLVTSTPVPGTDIPRYDPGCNGELRLWDQRGARNIFSIQNGGNYIPGGMVIPASDLFSSPGQTITLFMEGINPADPENTRITADVDPTGKAGFVVHDAVWVTVAKLQLVYTDVSGITHDTGDPEGILGVPRISPNLEPQGIATDWMNNVDDGSSLLVRAVGSPALVNLAASSYSNLTFSLGEMYGAGLRAVDPNDGYLHPLTDDFVTNAEEKLQTLGIENIGQQWGTTGLTVLNAEFYRPPNEFDLADQSDTDMQRRFPLGVEAWLHGAPLAEGAKPAGLTLTRPPLVLVHGINSSPGMWNDASGGQSFNQAVSSEYPHTFAVDHSGADPVNPAIGTTYGEGEIGDMYRDVEQTIGQANNAYRSGTFFNGDPYATPNPNNPGVFNAMIAVQKVDVVAHSYGGLLTRWYMEQSGEFEARRDVRKLIEVGTPNLGSPLANIVDEIYRNPVLGQAFDNKVGLVSMSWLLSWLDGRAKSGADTAALASQIPGTNTPFPFYEDASVGSQRIHQLNDNPFADDVAYAAVVGTHVAMQGSSPALSWVTNRIDLEPYSAFEPVDTKGNSYFPWLYRFDGAGGATDSIVPTWSAALGVSPYNFFVDADHTHLVQNGQVQAQVLSWLNSPNLPLGSAQRSAWVGAGHNQPPINDRNAYQGATIDPTTGQLTGGGVNPDAIVGVSIPGTGLAKATIGTDPAQAGAYVPTLTGMIQVQSRQTQVGVDLVSADVGGDGGTFILDRVNVVPADSFAIKPSQLAGAQAGDWVAFTFSSPSLVFGRRHFAMLTGPTGDSGYLTSLPGVGYQMTVSGVNSPATPILLPDFVLPPPTINGLNVMVTGSIEYDPDENFSLVLKAKEPWYEPDMSIFDMDPNFVQSSIITPPPLTHPSGTAGVTFWKGLLVPYSVQVALSRDDSGNVYGPSGNTGGAHPAIYQDLSDGSGDVASGPVTI